MRREREPTAARRSPQVKRRPSPPPSEDAAWTTARRSGSRRAARSNTCDMQHGVSASAIPAPKVMIVEPSMGKSSSVGFRGYARLRCLQAYSKTPYSSVCGDSRGKNCKDDVFILTTR
jgi:hypothetical protein